MKKITLVLLSIILILCSVQISAQTTFNDVDYNDPPQNSSTICPAFFKFRDVKTQSFSNDIQGTIKRVLHWKNYSIVLSHTTDRTIAGITQTYKKPDETNSVTYRYSPDQATFTYSTPHLYLIEHKPEEQKDVLYTLNVANLNTDNNFNVTPHDNDGHYCTLSDIAISADGYLMGINYVRMYHRLHHPNWDISIWPKRGKPEKEWENSPDDPIDYKPNTVYIYRWSSNNWNTLSNITNGKFTRFYYRTQHFSNDESVSNPNAWNWWMGNYRRADVGYSLSVHGTVATKNGTKCTITYTADMLPYPANASSYTNFLRFISLKRTRKNDTWSSKAKVSRSNETNSKEFKKASVGNHYKLSNPPYYSDAEEQKLWIIDGENNTPQTFYETTKVYSVNTIDGAHELWTKGKQLSNTEYVKTPISNNYFRYGKRNVMISPYIQNNKIQGIQLVDMGVDFSKAAPIAVVGINKEMGFATIPTNGHIYSSATAQVDGEDLTVYFWVDKTLYTYTTKEVEQARGVFAYGLSSSFDSHTNDYTFKFKVNEYPYKAVLKLYKESANAVEGGGGTLVASHILVDAGSYKNEYIKNPIYPNATKLYVNPGDEYIVKIAGNQLTVENGVRKAEPGTKLTWAIEVTDSTVYNWEQLYEDDYNGCYRSFVTVDKSPESPHFGQIYQLNLWQRNTTDEPNNGIIVHNAIWTTQSKTYNRDGTTEKNYNYPVRLAVDSTGLLYIPDHKGNLYIADPAKLGEPNSYTKWNNTWSADNHSRIASVATWGTGENAEVVIYRNVSGTSKYIDIYKLDENGNHTTDPTRTITINANNYTKGVGEGNTIPTSKGYFHIAQTNYPTAKRNTLLFYQKNAYLPAYTSRYMQTTRNLTTFEETVTDGKSSGKKGWRDWLECSPAAGAAVTNDESCIVISITNTEDENGEGILTDTDNKPIFKNSFFHVMPIDWEQLPTNPNAYMNSTQIDGFFPNGTSYDHDFQYNYTSQMSFDYGNNLIVASHSDDYQKSYIGAYAMPKLATTNRWLVKDDDLNPVDVNTIILDDSSSPYINRTETPARSITEYNTEQCDDYDRVFTGKVNNQWAEKGNWIPNPAVDNPTLQTLPYPDHRVRIDAPVKIEGMTNATAGYIDINKNLITSGTPLTISPTGGLTVGGSGVLQKDFDDKTTANDNNAVEGLISSVSQAAVPTDATNNPYFNPTLRADRKHDLTETDILIQAGGTTPGDATQGSLALHNIMRMDGTTATDISNNKNTDTKATVEIYGQYPFNPNKAEGTDNRLIWQYIATPFDAKDAALTDFYGSWMYQWDEEKATWYILSGWNHPLKKFDGYLLTQETPKTYSFTGNLHPSTEQQIALTFKGTNSYKGANFLGNSWTAPLQIDGFKNYTAFNNCEATIYLYAPKARQYVTIPINNNTTGITQINALQGFFVLATANNNASVTLKYDELVSKTNQPYIADQALEDAPKAVPHRVQAVEPTEKQMMRIYVQGSDKSTDEIVLCQHEDYTLGFDNGYDGRKMLGGEGTPYFTACAADGDMAVLATPAFYGTTLNFRRGTAKEYTLSFDYDAPDSDLVLQDLLTKEYVEIRTGNTYTFTATDENLTKRFRITRRSTEMVEYEPDAYVVQGKLYVDNPTDEVIGVALFSVDGKLISHFGTRDALCELEVPCEGVYIVHLTTSKGTTTIKQIL